MGGAFWLSSKVSEVGGNDEGRSGNPPAAEAPREQPDDGVDQGNGQEGLSSAPMRVEDIQDHIRGLMAGADMEPLPFDRSGFRTISDREAAAAWFDDEAARFESARTDDDLSEAYTRCSIAVGIDYDLDNVATPDLVADVEAGLSGRSDLELAAKGCGELVFLAVEASDGITGYRLKPCPGVNLGFWSNKPDACQ